MNIKMLPSMACVDFTQLKSDIDAINRVPADYLHCDIADGHYVPNMFMGPNYIKDLRKMVKAPLDIHLITERPEEMYPMFDLQPGEQLIFHLDAARHPLKLAKTLRGMGVRVGVAINPNIPLRMVEDLMDDIDFLHIMLVNPGFVGQPLVPVTRRKITQAVEMIRQTGREMDIEVDGCVDYENIQDFLNLGATAFVLGPYSCFDRSIGIEAAFAKSSKAVVDAGFQLNK